MTKIGLSSRYLVPVAGAALLAVLLFVTFGGAVRVSAQSPVAVTPNVVGDWGLVGGVSCGFLDVREPDEQPQCGFPSGEPPRPFFKVTVQEGRAFAGTFPWQPGSKITGAIAEDGTFLMRAWVGSNNRWFLSGRFYFTRNALEMRALVNNWEEMTASTPSMNSSWMTFRKVN